MEEHTVVAVDVAKVVFELAVSEEPGRVKLHRRLSRGEVRSSSHRLANAPWSWKRAVLPTTGRDGSRASGTRWCSSRRIRCDPT